MIIELLTCIGKSDICVMQALAFDSDSTELWHKTNKFATSAIDGIATTASDTSWNLTYVNIGDG